jgi:hypothetical protein
MGGVEPGVTRSFGSPEMWALELVRVRVRVWVRVWVRVENSSCDLGSALMWPCWGAKCALAEAKHPLELLVDKDLRGEQCSFSRMYCDLQGAMLQRCR